MRKARTKEVRRARVSRISTGSLNVVCCFKPRSCGLLRIFSLEWRAAVVTAHDRRMDKLRRQPDASLAASAVSLTDAAVHY
jgi:hypothetical protein